jgi:predicted TIM-barrel fold metal-dependent hydrolase
LKYPDLKITMSEGGIGWVAMLLDRLDNIVDRSGYGLGWETRPADVLKRNFWFCTIDDPSTIVTRHRIGVENIMLETDYPHGDGTWPDTQQVVADTYGDLPSDELRLILCENAARVFRHPLPNEVLPR